MPRYVKELKACGVTDVVPQHLLLREADVKVRTCEPTYSPELFEKEGIQAGDFIELVVESFGEVHEMTFPDGAAPPEVERRPFEAKSCRGSNSEMERLLGGGWPAGRCS